MSWMSEVDIMLQELDLILGEGWLVTYDGWGRSHDRAYVTVAREGDALVYRLIAGIGETDYAGLNTLIFALIERGLPVNTVGVGR